jgi:hypothetical protein
MIFKKGKRLPVIYKIKYMALYFGNPKKFVFVEKDEFTLDEDRINYVNKFMNKKEPYWAGRLK